MLYRLVSAIDINSIAYLECQLNVAQLLVDVG